MNLAEFDSIRTGDIIDQGKDRFSVTDVAATREGGVRIVNTVMFDDGTCITRQDGLWLLRAMLYRQGESDG